MSDETKKQRRQTPREYVALMVGDGACQWSDGEPARKFTSTSEVRAWVKKHGQAGQSYQVACFIGMPLTVNVETVEKRTLGSA